jgi:endonuclease-3 related protein
MLAADFGGSGQALLALPAAELRAKLLATYGIGEETADDIVLYAAHQPVFVVDAYTIRLLTRLGLLPAAIALGRAGKIGSRSTPPVPVPAVPAAPSQVYRAWQRLFMEHLPPDVSTFNEYHALIVRHGVVRCRKRDPRCGGCPLLDICPDGQARLLAVGAAAREAPQLELAAADLHARRAGGVRGLAALDDRAARIATVTR